MKKLLFYILSTMLIFTSCKTKSFTPTTYEKEQITFGNGGGITGAIVEYTLLSNGQLFEKSGNTHTQITKLKKNQATQIFENYKLLGLDRKVINDPGNMYFFIQRKSKDTLHKIVWGNKPVSDNRMTIYFANLMKIIKDTNSRKKEHITK